MNALEEYTNDTISLSHIHIIMPLISILSNHFLVNSFDLITNLGVESTVALAKISSEYYLEINCNKKDVWAGDKNDYNKGSLVMGMSDLNFSEVLNATPKLIVAVYAVGGNDSVVPKFLTEIVIPPSVAFFVIPVITLYKPKSELPLKAFPTMFYGGFPIPKWTWESKNTNWFSFKKEVRNMRGINISLALVSHLEEKPTVDEFWKEKNSFFWRLLEESLHYRTIVKFRQISLASEKTTGNMYRKMLQTEVDGLGVLPIMTSERISRLKFVATGIDQKYHLMVRKPQYVHSWNSIFKPLTNASWISLGIAILLISLTLRMATASEKSQTVDLSSCFIMIFGFVCSQGCPNMPANLPGRTVCYVALLFSILIYQFYTSNFYSLLSTKEVSLPFSSIEGLVTKRTHTLYVNPETGIYSYIMAAENGTFKKVGDLLRADKTHPLTKDRDKQCIERVCKGTAAILGLPSQTLHYSNVLCELVPVNSGYLPRNTILALRKTFPFLSQFQYVHLRLKETGITHKFRDDFFTVQQQHRTKREVENEPVTMIHVAFLFVLHFAAIILSWIILGIEIIVSKTIKNKKARKLR